MSETKRVQGDYVSDPKTLLFNCQKLFTEYCTNLFLKFHSFWFNILVLHKLVTNWFNSTGYANKMYSTIFLSFCDVEQIISNQAGQSVVGSYVYVKIEYPAGFLVALPRIKRCRYAAIYNMFLLLQCQSFGLCMYVYSCYWTKI